MSENNDLKLEVAHCPATGPRRSAGGAGLGLMPAAKILVLAVPPRRRSGVVDCGPCCEPVPVIFGPATSAGARDAEFARALSDAPGPDRVTPAPG